MPISRPSHSRKLARLALLLSALLITLLSTQAAAQAASPHSSHRHHASHPQRTRPASRPRAAGSLPPEGIWDSCDLNANLALCEQRLAVIAKGGFKVVVMGIFYSSEANMAAYAAYAQSLGMGVMWEINDPGFWGSAWNGSSAAADYSQFAQACGCSSTNGVLGAMISFLASLPGTYGYYAADDSTLGPGQTAGLRQFVAQIKAIDPGHMVMIGANASQGQSNASTGAVLGNEIYPVTTSNIQNVGRNLATWDSVSQEVSQAQSSAARSGQGSAFILQAFTFGDNLSDGQAVGACTASMTQQQCYSRLLYPSEQVQLELRNAVLAHSHPKLILWWSFQGTYGQSGNDTYSIYPTGAVAQARWSGLTRAINAPLAGLATAARAKGRSSRHGGHGRGHARTPHRKLNRLHS